MRARSTIGDFVRKRFVRARLPPSVSQLKKGIAARALSISR